MKCPRCGSINTCVDASRKKEGTVKRVRWCNNCETTFNTIEVLDEHKGEVK